MFKVVHYKTKKVFMVYGISETMQSVPMFLMYIDCEWVWKFANDYMPVL